MILGADTGPKQSLQAGAGPVPARCPRIVQWLPRQSTPHSPSRCLPGRPPCCRRPAACWIHVRRRHGCVPSHDGASALTTQPKTKRRREPLVPSAGDPPSWHHVPEANERDPPMGHDPVGREVGPPGVSRSSRGRRRAGAPPRSAAECPEAHTHTRSHPTRRARQGSPPGDGVSLPAAATDTIMVSPTVTVRRNRRVWPEWFPPPTQPQRRPTHRCPCPVCGGRVGPGCAGAGNRGTLAPPRHATLSTRSGS